MLSGKISAAPTQWLLTTAPAAGRETYCGETAHIKDDRKSSLPQSGAQRRINGAYEGAKVVIVLTALEVEYSAVRAHLHDLQLVVHPAGTHFEVGHLPGCSFKVALSVVGEGNQTAAVVTERSTTMFGADTVLFVGVAGALHTDLALGDVVVATRVYSYQAGKEVDEGFLARPRAWDAPHHLEQHARFVGRAGIWQRRLPLADRMPAHAHPIVHFRPIAAGEVVLSSSRCRLADMIRQQYSDAAAVETEGEGVARAAHLNRSLSALIIRGISDRADNEKRAADEAGWQNVASANAAAFAMSLLVSLSASERLLETASENGVWTAHG